MLTQWGPGRPRRSPGPGWPSLACGCGPLLEEAGLRPLGMTGIQPHWGPGDEDGLAFLVENMRVMEPLLVGTGVATAEEIGMETFEQRLRDEWKKDPSGSRYYHAAERVGDHRPGVTLGDQLKLGGAARYKPQNGFGNAKRP